MITCTFDEPIARKIIADPEHAGHAFIITVIVDNWRGERPYTVKRRTPLDAATELDRIANGAGNYADVRFHSMRAGDPFALIDTEANQPHSWIGRKRDANGNPWKG